MLVNPKDYIGKITTSRLPFYDSNADRVKYKSRPVLIIGVEKNSFPCDFNVLPVSTISKGINRHFEFDYELDQNKCTKLSLNKYPSFIRVHKQSTCYSTDINRKIICDLMKIDCDIYKDIKELQGKFSETLF